MRKVFFLLSFLFLFSCGRSSEENIPAKTIDSLENEILELKQANDTLSDHLLQRAYLVKSYPSYFDSISNPEEHILEKLQNTSSLIPKDPVLGGTMRFTTIDFLNDDLFVGSYEDGHVMGKAFYSYVINDKGELQFRLIGTVK